jgi:hypothetical protein
MSRAARKTNTRSAGKSPSITDLYKDFAKAHAAYQAVPKPKPPSVTSKEFDRAVSKCANIAARIVTAPAHSIDEMLLKIAVAGWSVGAAGGYDLATLEDWKPHALTSSNGEELEALVSLRDDLRRLQAR